MNEQLVSKMINPCVAYMDVAVRRIGKGREQGGSFVKLSNSGAITGVPPSPKAPTVGDLDHFESQSDSPRLDQRPLVICWIASS